MTRILNLITTALDLLDLRAATRRAELRATAYRLVAGDRARNGSAKLPHPKNSPCCKRGKPLSSAQTP